MFARGSPFNAAHFYSPRFERRLGRAARLSGPGRYAAFGRLDVDLARNDAPAVAVGYENVAELVSARVDRRCVVLRWWLRLGAVCLK